MPAKRGAAGHGRTALQINSIDCGFVISAEGGDPGAEVIREPAGAFVHKSLGPVGYSNAKMGLSLPLADPLWDWIKRTWTAKPPTVELTFVRVDPTGQARGKRVLHNASITEVAFPALDSASKDPAVLTFTVKAEKTVDTKATGKVASPTKTTAQRRWLASGFRFGLSGLDTKAVSRIESFSVTSTPGAAIDFPSLRVTLPATQSKPWQEWFDHFVLQGHNTAGDEKSGVIVLLAPDRREFARIKLEGVGIARLARLSSDSETAVSRLTADLYCQRMGFGPTS